ncbi:MAG: Smr/MutS family protein [Prevotella sp.]|nr:Smr/MutS family protein [Prevotella sp.]
MKQTYKNTHNSAKIRIYNYYSVFPSKKSPTFAPLIMEAHIEQKTGFDRIRAMVVEECSNELARRMAAEMAFSSDYEQVMHLLRQTEEMRHIVMFAPSFPSQDFIDLTLALSALRIENTAIEQAELFEFKVSLHTLTACLHFLLDEDQEEYPELRKLAERVELDPAVLRIANKIVDDKGEVYDDASPELQEIRRRMQRKRSDVDVYLSRALSRAKQEGWSPENAEITIRNGRLVIPMLDTHRRKMKGLIHDESATRQTAYLEPAEVVELNNDLRELEFAERREIQRILMRFSDRIRPMLPQLLQAYWFLGRIDFIRAKAHVALQMNAGLPIVDNETKLQWLEARHPLLYLQRKAEGRQQEVVPFSMTLDPHHRILIISGPNAGGKSVCLKAVGLIQYMLQCGMLVPCRQTSEFGIFDHLFIDIGDQQSIDDDLSTYTSHLQNMRMLLEEADGRTLFLLDELGGGTEPRSGCAIAEALLEALDARGAFGVVTTHFADLKLLADHHPTIANGAMLFDTERMRPLYQLSIGHPGSSFAFEIAENVGLPKSLLQAAAAKVGNAMLNFEHQLQQLEQDKQVVAQRQAQLDASDAFLSEVIDKYQQLTDKLETKKYDILSKARAEARSIVNDANRVVEQTISDIKAAQADREQTHQARERLRQKKELLQTEQDEHERQVAESVRRQSKREHREDRAPNSFADDRETPITIGTIVRIDGQDTFGQVVEIKGKKAVVESNSIRMTITLDRLQGTAKQALPQNRTNRHSNRFQSIYDEMNEKRKQFNPTIDLRGQRADEALSALQHFFDDAQLLGEKELRILHGKGYGILKQMIREWLQTNRDVQTFHSERLELGGDGITVVSLR